MPMKAVLLIEDEEQDREIYSRLLYYNGYDLLFAESGEEGVRMAEDAHPALVLLDLILPGMDGFETLVELRQRLGAEVPIVMITAHSDEEVRRRAVELGASGFIEKPAAPLDVLREVRRLIGDPDGAPESEPGASA